MNKGKDANICFDCANAYAHKCEYIRRNKPKRITECECFVPDYIAESLTAILKYLGVERYYFSKIGDKGLKKIAKEKGCKLYVIEDENGRKQYRLRLVKNNKP